eukprot:4135756-Amphidinium_carterae.5
MGFDTEQFPEFDSTVDLMTTNEEKGDVLEAVIGLNFLEKEGRLSCEDMGIVNLPDARESMLKVEWLAFKKGLAWSLAHFARTSILTAIVAK